MKTVFILTLLWCSVLSAEKLVYPDGKEEVYVKAEKSGRNLGTANTIYYKEGSAGQKQRYIDTRQLFVSFGKQRELDAFMQKYQLSLVKVVNPYFFTVLFHVDSDVDIVTLCTKINHEETVRYARPNWRAPRILR